MLSDGQSVSDPQHQIGGFRSRHGASNPLLFHWPTTLMDAGGIEQGNRIAAKVEMDLDHVPGGAWKWRHNRRLALRQPVKQGGLASIRRSGDGDDQSIAQMLGMSTIGKNCDNLIVQMLRGK